MAFDGIFLKQITKQLQTIVPCKINRIHQVSDTELLFQLRHERTKYQLLISAHSLYNRINITTRTYPTPEIPSNFIMLLRKHLEGSIILSIEQGGFDRYLIFTISGYNELGDQTIRHLYVELMGKYANVILANENGKIMDALKRIPPFENTKRIIQPGALFQLPEPQLGQLNPFEQTGYTDDRPLTAQFEGFSPLLSKEIEYRIHHGENFVSIMQEIQASDQVYITNANNQTYFHCIPLKQFETESISYPINEGLDYLFYEKEERDRIRQQTGDLFKFVRREIKKYTSKIAKLTDSLEEAQNSEHWKEKGELLYSYLPMVKKGMTSITLPSFETQEDIVIPLDPKLDAKQNAKKCFQKYTKGKNGMVHIQEQLDIANQELEYFRNLEYQLTVANFQDAKEIHQELAQNGYVKANVSKIRKKKKEVALNYHTLTSPSGYPVYFGKNNLQNEYLTFKKAHRTDLWFHVKDMHGSHVILQTEHPEESDIRFAAMVAAYYSSGRESSSIPVNYCPVKNIKKIPGGKTGMVILSSYKTIYIDITPEFLNLIKQK
ncbi:MAG: NFACT RNA binding domain-containing protein [Erysipelotrichaceae bacterium]|nr:NFACT RNA binding domain-containing protein [Erysipelotrichaceae bacterium]